MKLFGKLTRTKSDWYPCSLLCKRFNVQEPEGSSGKLIPKKRLGFSVFDFLEASQENFKAPLPTPSSELSTAASSATCAETPRQESTHSEVQTPQNNQVGSPDDSVPFVEEKILAAERTGEKIDLYKAIFLSSSEDEAEEASEEFPVTTQQSAEKYTPVLAVKPAPAPVRQVSPPRGIFSCLDQMYAAVPTSTAGAEMTPRGQIAKVSSRVDNANANRSDVATQSVNAAQQEDVEVTYGPALPAVRLSATQSSAVVSLPPPVFTSDLHWVEKTKKNKESKKHKHSHGKHKKHKEHKTKKHKKESRKKR